MSTTTTTNFTMTCPKCDAEIFDTETVQSGGESTMLVSAMTGAAAGFLGCLITFVTIAQLLGHRGTP